MNEILCISTSELNAIKLSLNAYLALLTVKYGNIKYRTNDDDIEELYAKQWVNNIHKPQLTKKAIQYFNNEETFKEFYNTFPHIAEGDYGDKRPLRAASIDTNAARATKVKWNRKTRGNQELQEKIIKVLGAEVNWREQQNSLKYMHNIDTWLNQNDYEKYEYLLSIDSNDDMSLDLSN